MDSVTGRLESVSLAFDRAACLPASREKAGMEEKKKSTRGFASMSPEKRAEIARKGGKSVPPEKRSFAQNTDLAAQAGRKGGQNVPPEKRSFSRDPKFASEAGAKGGAVKAIRVKREEP